MPLIDIPNSLPHTFAISRMETTADLMGGDVPAPVSVATGRAGFAQTASQREIERYSKRGATVTHKVYVSAATAALLAEDSILHAFTPTTQFASTFRLRVACLADATVNMPPALRKVFAVEEFGDVEHQ